LRRLKALRKKFGLGEFGRKQSKRRRRQAARIARRYNPVTQDLQFRAAYAAKFGPEGDSNLTD